MAEVIFVPECYIDTTLTEFFVKDKKLIVHEQGIHGVAKNFIQIDEARPELTIVGIIDNDKKTPRHFDNFEIVSNENNVILKVLPNKQHYLIVLSPAIERFILDCSQEAKLDLKEFNLSYILKEFKRITKKESIKENPDFRNLLLRLKETSPPGFARISELFERFLS